MRRIRLLGILVAAMLAGGVFMAQPAGTVPPDISDSETSDAATFEDECGGGIDLQRQQTIRTRTQTFYKKGEATRILLHGHLREMWTRSDTGNTLIDPADVVVVFDLVNGTVSVNGGNWRVTSPGEGIIIQATGKIVFDEDNNVLFVAGPRDVPDFPARLALYCDVLA